MGKAGKEKKRRKKVACTFPQNHLEGVGETRSRDHESNDDDSEDECADPQTTSHDSSDMTTAIRVLGILGQCPDLYESKPMKSLRTLLFPLINHQVRTGSHFELNEISNLMPDRNFSIGSEKIAALFRVTSAFCDNMEKFSSSDGKQFRAALHPLVLRRHRQAACEHTGTDSLVGANRNHSARVSSAFRSRDWSLTLKELCDMYYSGEIPKLGAVQRWVRECDFALQATGSETKLDDGSGKNTSLLLLDAVMRVASSMALTKKRPSDSKSETPSHATVLTYQTKFESTKGLGADVMNNIRGKFGPKFISECVEVVSHVPGASRRPPSDTDLNIYTMAPGSISFPTKSLPSKRCDVENVEGAFLIQNVLSVDECCQLTAAAEAIGFAHDAVAGIDNIVLYADESLLNPIFERCRQHLPQDGLMGINSRFRFFRYTKGAVYRPHIDGSWPGSGLVDGKYVDDAFGGARNSKLTFLMYLNGDEDFSGGSTTFFVPGETRGHIEARAVHPQRGGVLIFPHGSVTSPVHEGSEICEGSHKYVIRTDVLYST